MERETRRDMQDPEEMDERELEPLEHYDPERAPDAEAWLLLGEQERVHLVEAHYEEAPPDVPSLELFCLMQATVETQLALDAPPAVRQTLARLMAARVRRSVALKAIGEVLARLMQQIVLQKDSGEDPNVQYARLLEQLHPQACGER